MSSKQAYAVHDPTVVDLAKFLEQTPLSNGASAPLPPGVSQLVAQAVCNYTQGLVWDRESRSWTDLDEWAKNPSFDDVTVRKLEDGDDVVYRLTHRPTNLSVLAETPEEAWETLKEKVARRA
ncbi:hypothetical protein SEA_GHOBES_24 [Gordonia phage Ghobes]|uniref:Uncharacterized protein n=1 Tax=Gordonia phage Ghobes TaxID=1887647 RepID=A0A1B3B079_9CAUD|nr:hypothetical protein KCH37_gp24 [Gordonia phage Ghobes]AOE44376.1 hypothetical protein SEA_GHOBES_24 [Gordonia phage Ghobes]